MELLTIWLPKIASCIIILIGFVGFFKPKSMLDSMQFEMGSKVAISEARGVFGGLNIGTGTAALYLADPTLYTVMGFTWLIVTAARPYSMIVDGTSLKDSVPPICVDLTVALLFLSQYLLN
tara:strand:+ start:423 stop:785 length:363 start_codon:yes stop_codon:yes gene_type:complete